MHKDQEQTKVASPSMEHSESFMSDAGDVGDEVRFHRRGNDPGCHCDCHHTSSNS